MLYPNLIRAVAITLVIILHAISSFTINYSQTSASWWVGNFYDAITRPCIPLFVMLSGALLLNPSKVDEPIRVFLRKRVNRIGLAFLFWGVVYFIWRSLADHEVLTFNVVWQNFLGVNGQYPYIHFWFLYMLFGLYLATPILRVLIAHANSKILGYFLLLWFLGTGVVPLFERYVSVSLNSFIFIAPAWLGYYVLGAYLQRNIHLRSSILYAIMFSGFLWTVADNWFVTATWGGLPQFVDFLSANVVLASGALFLLLRDVSTDNLERRFPNVSWLIRRIGRDSFAVYLLHVIVLGVLGVKGLFGFNLGIINVNPILGIPLLSFCTLAVSFGVIWLLRKVPMLNKAIG